MNKWLGPDSKIYGALSLAADLVIVNVLLVVSCFPIFTGGMALRTAHEIIGKMVREEGSRPGRSYLRGLLARPLPNTLWWLLNLAVILLVVYEFWVFSQAGLGATTSLVLKAAVISGLVVFSCISVWFFHLEGRYSDSPVTLIERVREAAMHAVRYLPRTLVAVLPLVALVLLPIILVNQWGLLVFAYVVIAPALAIYLSEIALQWPELDAHRYE